MVVGLLGCRTIVLSDYWESDWVLLKLETAISHCWTIGQPDNNCVDPRYIFDEMVQK